MATTPFAFAETATTIRIQTGRIQTDPGRIEQIRQ
jgi:hypothetical protein